MLIEFVHLYIDTDDLCIYIYWHCLSVDINKSVQTNSMRANAKPGAPNGICQPAQGQKPCFARLDEHNVCPEAGCGTPLDWATIINPGMLKVLKKRSFPANDGVCTPKFHGITSFDVPDASMIAEATAISNAIIKSNCLISGGVPSMPEIRGKRPLEYRYTAYNGDEVVELLNVLMPLALAFGAVVMWCVALICCGGCGLCGFGVAYIVMDENRRQKRTELEMREFV